MEYLFWLSLSLVLYTYLGYPCLLGVRKLLSPLPVRRGFYEPSVSVVLAARNEDHNIAGRLENLLGQHYPPEKLEIVAVSDGSEDGTVEALRRFSGSRVKVIALPHRVGKAAALNSGVAAAQGELVVFCDARQRFAEDAVKQLASNFADPSVGCVSGELVLVASAESNVQVELGGYWRYEKWLRRAESATGSVVGATGCISAIRRTLYRDLPRSALLDDVLTPMQIVMQGWRNVFDGTAKAYDIVSRDLNQEWTRKQRTLAGNWQMLQIMPALLLPWRNPVWVRFVSHKVLRLLVPFALVLLALTAPLADGKLCRTVGALQTVFYSAAAFGAWFPALRSNRFISLSYFFLVMNLVAVSGFWRWATRRSATAWSPAYRKGDA